VNRQEYLHLLSERADIERMLAETSEDGSAQRASLTGRLKQVEDELARIVPKDRAVARVRLTFRGRPVIGGHGIFADFGMKAVSSFAESVATMAASLTAPLEASDPIAKDEHQLLITSTVPGSFGFELEEHRSGQLTPGDASAVTHALGRTQCLLHGTLGTDDELADSAAEAHRRALDKIRAFLETLADNEAVCTVQFGESIVSFSDVGQVRTSIARLSQENLREDQEELAGELQGVLPQSRAFEFKMAGSSHVIRGKIAPTISDPGAFNRELNLPVTIKVMVRRVGNGHPRYLLLEPPRKA
jgi:hypothetical protein